MNDERASEFDDLRLNRKKLDDMHRIPADLMTQLVEKRRTAGRYTLEEAAVAVVHGVASPDNVDIGMLHWERDWPLLSKLIQSARLGELSIYSPEGLKTPPDEASTVQWFSKETYWKDLNAWLAKNEPNVLFRFLPPVDPVATSPLDCPGIRTEQDEYPDDSGLGLGKRERQIRRVEWAAKQLGYEPTAIPDGGKAKLREFCKTNFPTLLQSENSFNKTWLDAGGQKDNCVRLRMANHEKFTNKGT